jgi:hypothetical protein
MNAFGQRWQVLDTDPKLFQTVSLAPASAHAYFRRPACYAVLSVVSRNYPEGLRHWGDGTDDCVFDVLTTGDLK